MFGIKIDNQIIVQRPSIWAIDLKTDTVIGRYEIPLSIVQDGKGLASITIDDDDCLNSFAYLPDWFYNSLIVYSTQQNKAWRFNNAFFHFNPFEADFNVDGTKTFSPFSLFLLIFADNETTIGVNSLKVYNFNGPTGFSL